MSFIRTNSYRVGPAGPITAKLAFVGEAPGEQEIREGKPFVGPAGNMLDKLLLDSGILRRDVYLTNVIKERPEKNDITQFINLSKKNIVITPEARQYIEELHEELRHVAANCIVPLGNTALYALTGLRGITKWRGSILPSIPDGRKLLPTFHPRVLTGREAVYLWRYPMLWDLKRALEQSKFPEIREQAADLRVSPNFTAVCEWLDALAQTNIVDFDIEVLRMEVSCIAMGCGTTVMSIPFVDSNGDYWNPEQEAVIWRKIAHILEDPSIEKRGQNCISFDATFLHHRHGIRTVNMRDTMVAQGILFPDLPKGLDFLCSVYSDIPYYKDEGKKWKRLEHPWEQHWLYNAKDSLATAVIHPNIVDQLIKQQNYETYRRQESIGNSLVFMSARGIRMDTNAIAMAKESVTTQIENLKQELYKEVGYEINYSSPQQLMNYFYNELRQKPYVNRKTKKPTVDSIALRRLARKYPAAKILQQMRKLSKLESTYLGVSLDHDNRLRCSFNPVGTKFGRLSSSKTIFDTGMNLQNQPQETRIFMLYDEGYIGYNIDYSQGENRIVAYAGPVPEMIEAFEGNKDVHSLTASLITGGQFSPEEIKQQDKDDIKCPLGGGIYTWRFWGKKANHGLNYDLGPNTFAEYYEIDYSESRFIVDRYHQVYPGVRQSFQQQIRDSLSRTRTVTNPMGRKILFLDRWGDQLFKDAYASFPQSTIADMINEYGLAYIYNNQDLFGPVELLLQVHDSIMFQIPRSVPLIDHARMLLKIKYKLETPIRWKAQEFVIPVDIQVSTTNMAKGKGGGLHDLPSNSYTDAETLAQKIAEIV